MDSSDARPSESSRINNLIDFHGCSFLLIPPQTEYLLTSENGTGVPWTPQKLAMYAVNCTLSTSELNNAYNTVAEQVAQIPFRGSVVPVMIVLSLCVIASWFIIFTLFALRRRRPLAHEAMLAYSCAIICLAFFYLHHFVSVSHRQGFESIDMWFSFWFGTARSAAIYATFSFFLLTEIHILYCVHKSAKMKLSVLVLGSVIFIVDTVWWIVGVARSPIYDLRNRAVSNPIHAWYYVEIVVHVIYLLVFGYSIYLRWSLAFDRGNRAVGSLAIGCSILPMICMILTAAVDWCFAWCLFLSMVARSLCCVFSWDWINAINRLDNERQQNGNLGRLVVEPALVEEFQTHLQGDGNGHGTLRNESSDLWSKTLRILKGGVRVVSSADTFSNMKAKVVGGRTQHIEPGDGPDARTIGMSSTNLSGVNTSVDENMIHHPARRQAVTMLGVTFEAPDEAIELDNMPTFNTPSGDAASVRLSRASEDSESSSAPNGEPAAQPPGAPHIPSDEPVIGSSEDPPAFVPHPGFSSADYHNEKSGH